MMRLNDPHGGVLVDRVVPLPDAEDLRARAAQLPQLNLDRREAADLELIASGAASPLVGFLGLRDYQSVLRRLQLEDGTPWPVPFVLAVTIRQMASSLRHGAAALRDPLGRFRGVIEITDAFVRNREDEALALYGSADRAVSGVTYVMARPAGTLGGRVWIVPPVNGHPRGPREVRKLARRQRWASIAGIATLDGSGCIEGAGDSSRSLLPTPPVALRGVNGRDAFLQAIVLKNHGARQIFFEHDRADWREASPDIAPEDLGVAPVWMVDSRALPGDTQGRQAPAAVGAGARAQRSRRDLSGILPSA